MTEAVIDGVPHQSQSRKFSLRLALVLLLSLSVSLPMAWISLAKLLLFVAGVFVLLLDQHDRSARVARLQSINASWPILASLAVFTLSLLWSVAPVEVALASLVKHSKLLVIPLIILMLRTQAEARMALWVFSLGLGFQLCVSWLLAIGVPIPWIAPGKPVGHVFTSYLDQSIIFSTCAAVWWHMKPRRGARRHFANFLVAAALANSLFLLDGKTGVLIAACLVGLAVMWHLPARLQWPALIAVPVLMIAAISLGSGKQSRVGDLFSELSASTKQVDTKTSGGWRINAWIQSARGIAERPLTGHGVGGFTQTVKRLQGERAQEVFGPGKLSNPHQEFLLWGIEIGVLGIVLLGAVMIAITSDLNRMTVPVRRAGLSTLLALLIGCSFNSSLYDALIGDYFVILLGILTAYGILSPERGIA